MVKQIISPPIKLFTLAEIFICKQRNNKILTWYWRRNDTFFRESTVNRCYNNVCPVFIPCNRCFDWSGWRRTVVSYWRKYVHEVLVNRLGGLCLPRKSVVRLIDRPDMTLDVYRGHKTTIHNNQLSHENWVKMLFLALFAECVVPA